MHNFIKIQIFKSLVVLVYMFFSWIWKRHNDLELTGFGCSTLYESGKTNSPDLSTASVTICLALLMRSTTLAVSAIMF